MVKNRKASRDLKGEAAKIVRAINVQGESRAETQRLQAGVQRAMEYYLRQHSAKARELDKKSKKVQRRQVLDEAVDGSAAEPENAPVPRMPNTGLPWVLLLLSWALLALYLLWV